MQHGNSCKWIPASNSLMGTENGISHDAILTNAQSALSPPTGYTAQFADGE
jgi:hypothetical protein